MATSASSDGDEKTKANRLLNEKSPYLLQHAFNPVDWFPWGEEAFAKARKEKKLIFLSVGYSTCHWCHVMEHESFENSAIAKILNDNFVSIKVDREERPDVDRMYMTFIQATTGGGGWPMSVWLTPDLKPIVGGTYFPPDDVYYGRPGFPGVLKQIAQKWRENPEGIENQGTAVTDAMMQASQIKAGNNLPDISVIEKCYEMIADSFDPVWGGFGQAPKFPQPVNFDFMLRFFEFCKTTKKNADDGEKALEMCQKSLEFMAKGGIHDHVSQGFHRYSTDRKWHVPHFEKMLYDQGQLAVTFAEIYQITKDPKFAEICADILTYVSRDLRNPEGGFYSAEDADSLPADQNAKKKREGAFCVWTYAELKELFSKFPANYLEIFVYYYNVKENGNVDPYQDPHDELKKQNVLMVTEDVVQTANHFKLSPQEVTKALNEMQAVLFEVRQTRPKPHRDTKILTAWNGLMLSGFAKCGAALRDEKWTNIGAENAEFLRKHMWKNGRLLRSCYADEKENIVQIEKPIEGFADDYAFLIQGLLDLYEANFDSRWLEWAVELQVPKKVFLEIETQMDALFWDSAEGGYFQTESGDDAILIRTKEEQDGAEPSANSVASLNLLRLANFLNRSDFRAKSEKVLQLFSDRLQRIPMIAPKMMCTLIGMQRPPEQIVIVGPKNDEMSKKFLAVVSQKFRPMRALVWLNGETDEFLRKSVQNFAEMINEKKPTVYFCKNFACSLPVSNEQDLKKLMDEN